MENDFGRRQYCISGKVVIQGLSTKTSISSHYSIHAWGKGRGRGRGRIEHGDEGGWNDEDG